MRKLNSLAISAALILTGVAPTSAMATWDLETSEFGQLGQIRGYVKQAFTLEEMNCFSSDIQALDPRAAPRAMSEDALDTLLASGSSGTNGIPCDAKDPKAPPKRKKRS
jgi:hypothetical protein